MAKGVGAGGSGGFWEAAKRKKENRKRDFLDLGFVLGLDPMVVAVVVSRTLET